MGIESRDYYREKFAPPKKRGGIKIPLRRPGTGQHVELAEMREGIGRSEARGMERRSGPHWLLAAWTLLLAAALALGGLAALLT